MGKVIKQFYLHSEKKTYNVGDEYNGKPFKSIDEYVKKEVKKTKVARETKKGVLKTK